MNYIMSLFHITKYSYLIIDTEVLIRRLTNTLYIALIDRESATWLSLPCPVIISSH